MGKGQLNANFTGSAENCRMDISGNEVQKDGTLSFETSIPKGDGKVRVWVWENLPINFIVSEHSRNFKVLQNVTNNTVTNQAAMKGDVVTAKEDQNVHVDGKIEENLVS